MQTNRSSTFGRHPPRPGSWLLMLAAFLGAAGAAAAEDRSGEQIYRQMCASCHGAAGEGTPEDYPRRAGGRPVGGAARPVHRQDDARGRPRDVRRRRTPRRSPPTSTTRSTRRPPRRGTQPARIELSRLTVRQYRNAVADLIGSFREPRKLGRPARAARRILQVAAVPRRRTASSSGSTPRSGSTSARTSPDPEKIGRRAVLDPLGRLGPGPRDGRVRVHRPDRARHAALGQRHRTAR